MFHAPSPIIGRLALALAASSLGSVALDRIGPVQAQPAGLTVLGGSARGSWYPIAVGIAEILNDAGTRASGQIGGGNANVVSVSSGQAEMGITFNFTGAMAAKGEEPFRQSHDDIRSIAGLFDNFMHLVVSESSGIESIPEFKGERFAMQPETAATTTMFRIILEAHGLSVDDLDIVERGSQQKGAEAIRDRRADGLSTATIWPTAVVTELAAAIPIRLVPIGADGLARIQKINPGLQGYLLPAGVYPDQDQPVEGVGSKTALIVDESMAEGDAYWITKTLAENLDKVRGLHEGMREMKLESMAQTEGIPLHPGAIKYYKEAGVL